MNRKSWNPYKIRPNPLRVPSVLLVPISPIPFRTANRHERFDDPAAPSNNSPLSTMKVVTFGEVMLRLATPGFLRLNQASALEMTFGGGEANVAVSLALFGDETASSPACPGTTSPRPASKNCAGSASTHRKSCAAANASASTSSKAAPRRGPRPSPTTAPTAAISEINPADLKWDDILKGADWFHFTGITPPFPTQPRRPRSKARARRKSSASPSVATSHFRKKTLDERKRPAKVMSGLMEHVDICIANEEDAEKVFGIKAGATEVTKGEV